MIESTPFEDVDDEEHEHVSLVKIPVYCSPLWDTRIENMLDIRLIREKPDYVRERLATRDTDLIRQVDAVLEIDAERRRLETEMQRLSGERNRLSKEIGALRSKKESSSELENKVRTIGDDIAKLGGHVSAVDEAQRELLYGIPNLPHPSVPIGTDASANPVIRIWGERPAFDFKPLDQNAIEPDVDLMRLAHAHDVKVKLALQCNLDSIVAIHRKVIFDRRAALRSEGQVVRCLVVLH